MTFTVISIRSPSRTTRGGFGWTIKSLLVVTVSRSNPADKSLVWANPINCQRVSDSGMVNFIETTPFSSAVSSGKKKAVSSRLVRAVTPARSTSLFSAGGSFGFPPTALFFHRNGLGGQAVHLIGFHCGVRLRHRRHRNRFAHCSPPHPHLHGHHLVRPVRHQFPGIDAVSNRSRTANVSIQIADGTERAEIVLKGKPTLVVIAIEQSKTISPLMRFKLVQGRVVKRCYYFGEFARCCLPS